MVLSCSEQKVLDQSISSPALGRGAYRDWPGRTACPQQERAMPLLSRTDAQGVKKFQFIAIKQCNPTCVRVNHFTFVARTFEQGINSLLFTVRFQLADDVEISVASPSKEESEVSRY